MLAFGYNTNGFAHHDLAEAIDVIADLGYAGVALTLDVQHLSPLRSTPRDVAAVASRLRARGLRSVVETGARYILDPRKKHEPTLLSDDEGGRERRLGFLRAAIDVAADLGAEAVALFSGKKDPATPDAAAWARLADGVARLLEGARVPLAFEPEPGMLVEDLAGFERLRAALGGPGAALRLTLDVGHVQCSEATSIPEAIARHAALLANVHIEDIRGRVHEHLPFGEGDIDFPPVLRAFEAARYAGLVNVELSRHSHDAPAQARKAIEFLKVMSEK